MGANKIDTALTESTALMAREAFQYSMPSIKGEIKSAHGYLTHIKQEECVVENAKCTPWCARVLKYLEHRYLVQSLGKEYGIVPSSDDDYEHNGQSRGVLDKVVAELNKAGGPTTLQGLLPLSMWRHLLSNEEKGQLLRWRDALLKKSKDTAKAAPSKSNEKKPTKKQSASTDDVEAAARALFRK
eukprot:2234066-Amphidinium_carterae.1